MQDFLQILREIAPILLLSFVFIYIFHEGLSFLRERDKIQREYQRNADLANDLSRRATSDVVINLELQAAERFVLYLERIAPDRLVMRLHQNGMSAKMLQTEMLRNIREEFDHNLSQQVYISEPAWELIRNAKDEMIKFISAAGTGMTERQSGIDLSQRIFEAASRVENLPSEVALKYLRKETRRLLTVS